jgi:branched-subunit amino acid aminotransferase/4-amino-4-deoxychorismate lyase
VIAVGSTTEVAGIVSVDARNIADGGVGPITTRLFDLYKQYVFEHCRPRANV